MLHSVRRGEGPPLVLLAGIGMAGPAWDPVADRLAADGVELVEQWDEPDYVSVKCRDPDGYIIEASWEP